MTDRPPRAFEVDDAGPRGASGVSVHGEVDIDTVQDLEVALDAAIRESDGAFTIDLADVGFLDSSGLHVLLRERPRVGSVADPVGRALRDAAQALIQRRRTKRSGGQVRRTQSREAGTSRSHIAWQPCAAS